MELSVFNISGADTGKKITLADSIFGIEKPNDHAIYLDVKQFLANQRQGTHKSKERWEVAYSTKKIKKQKGTGGARAGSIKSPLFVGGGRVFGPRPRDYYFKLNVKLKQLARRSALTYKAKEAQIKVLENISFEKPNTKNYLKMIAALAITTKKTLLVVPEHNENVYRSSTNLKKAKVVVAEHLNTYDVMNADTLILCEGSLEKITQILG
ncbi:MAG: 50S ribosomal protein L4 [Bacteroidetes bacterium]|nr:MAG: 50S ribosomal protein L4 [Bacteroidota bacterium]